MRMSCNGCRVLRKGCSEDCTLRPCLQWIKTPESQANATVFLAKFYGRAGLVNLINAVPEHLRPEVFKSLLYEACGRIINPIYGSVGLMWSGNWKRVQEAVESVLEGSPIMQVDQEEGRHHPIMPIKGSDIRHLSNKDTNSSSIVHHQHHHRIRAPRNRFKRPCRNTTNTNTNTAAAARGVVLDSVVTHEQQHDEPIKFSITGWVNEDDVDESDDQLMMMMMKRAESHDSFSVETVEHSLVNQTDQFVKSEPRRMASDPAEIIGLELTLGINPMRRSPAAFNLDVI